MTSTALIDLAVAACVIYTLLRLVGNVAYFAGWCMESLLFRDERRQRTSSACWRLEQAIRAHERSVNTQ